jgi:hypothetical protein
LEEITPWLKIDYYPKNPKSPAYLPGQPQVTSITNLAGVFSAMRSDVDVTKASYQYCNLSPTQWAALRAQTPAVRLIAWSPSVNTDGRREVATVDLRTDVFDTGRLTEQQFTNELIRMERAVREATGQGDFSLRGLHAEMKVWPQAIAPFTNPINSPLRLHRLARQGHRYQNRSRGILARNSANLRRSLNPLPAVLRPQHRAAVFHSAEHVQQNATPKLRNGALYAHFVRHGAMVIFANVYVGRTHGCTVVPKPSVWIKRPLHHS